MLFSEFLASRQRLGSAGWCSSSTTVAGVTARADSLTLNLQYHRPTSPFQRRGTGDYHRSRGRLLKDFKTETQQGKCYLLKHCVWHLENVLVGCKPQKVWVPSTSLAATHMSQSSRLALFLGPLTSGGFAAASPAVLLVSAHKNAYPATCRLPSHVSFC